MKNFREKQSSDSNYVTVIDGGSCQSSIGMRGGQQTLSLGQNGCMWSHIVQHEFMHAIGFHHMQSRPDRDDYVTVHYDNIEGGTSNFNFAKTDYLTFGLEYEPRSFMHYEYKDFAIDKSKPAMSSKVFQKIHFSCFA